MFQCVEDLIECLDGLLSLGGVHPFEKAFDEGIVLQGMFRAPLDHRMRIAPLVTAVARITIDSGAITRDSTSLPWCSGYEDRWSETTTSRPDVTVDALVERDLAAAPGVLPPANLPVVRHRRGRLQPTTGVSPRPFGSKASEHWVFCRFPLMTCQSYLPLRSRCGRNCWA